MKKLDEAKVNWIISQKHKRVATSRMADTMQVSAVWIKKLWAKHRHTRAKYHIGSKWEDRVTALQDAQNTLQYCAHGRQHNGATDLEKDIESNTGMHITHNTIHRILIDEDLASKYPKKSKQRKWVRYERRYSNSMWAY